MVQIRVSRRGIFVKKNYAYALGAFFMWSTASAITKMLLTNVPILETLSISGAFAFLFLLILNIINGTIKEVKKYSVKDYFAMAGFGFLGVFMYSALYYYGLTQLTSQEACILNYLWPIMLVMFSAIILKEKITVAKAVAIFCSFLGIIIMSTGSRNSTTGNSTLGILSCIIAAACYGLFSVLIKKADYNQNITMMVIWFSAAICSTVLGLLTETWKPIESTQWLGIIWIGVFDHAVAYLLWALALRNVDNTAKFANLAYLTPFLSLVVSAVVLKEKIQIRDLIALIFIVGGILLQGFYENLNKKQSSDF